MDLVLIAKLMEMLENSALEELDVSEAGVRIRLSKTVRGEASTASPSHTRSETPEAQASEIAALMALGVNVGKSETTVEAGLPGTFYRSPAPGEAPYAEEGTDVEEGQVLGLIEAMKMLNPVEAPRAGRIVRFLVADATPVEPGVALVVIEPAD